MPQGKRHKAEQPAALVPSQGGDAADVSRIDTAALWQAVCRVSSNYIAVVDRTGVIRFCSRVDEGWSPEQVIGRSMLDFTMPESTEQLYRVIEEVFATGSEQAIETSVRRSDGGLNYFSLRLGPVLVDGRTAAILVCCENILPLKTSEKSLHHERNLLRRLLTIQERERQLVSYEIHDGLAQYLAGAMMQLEACEHGLGGSSKNRELGEGLRLLRAAADEARRLIGGLRPPALDELGIIDAVETLVAEARTEVARVEFTHSLPARRLPPDVETTIFRIVQESLSNVRQHAHAGTASVRLEQHGDNAVRIVVQDDGIGFDLAVVADDRFGLEGIRQRAWLLGGEPLIASSPGGGTTVTVTLPIEPKDPIQALG
jgi:PAS domain S-box-containing protein